MASLLKNPLAYMSLSFVLFLIAFPLISVGTTGGPGHFLWAGLIALCAGALMPPLQRLICGPRSSPGTKPDRESGN